MKYIIILFLVLFISCSNVENYEGSKGENQKEKLTPNDSEFWDLFEERKDDREDRRENREIH